MLCFGVCVCVCVYVCACVCMWTTKGSQVLMQQSERWQRGNGVGCEYVCAFLGVCAQHSGDSPGIGSRLSLRVQMRHKEARPPCEKVYSQRANFLQRPVVESSEGRGARPVAHTSPSLSTKVRVVSQTMSFSCPALDRDQSSLSHF